MFVDQVLEKCLARILRNPFRRIYQAQSRWCDDGLLERDLGVTQRLIQVVVRITFEIVVVPLLAIRDHGRTGGLELLDGLSRRLLV